ncbi:ribonuclease H-like domain-containing protein [Xylogone sp. PMI_703]|nr:ribonuclease H-like domain-containing protein [Xylogone sp. PMI_703]
MAPELSSNWKKLQATLGKDPSASKGQKRKAAERNEVVKRQKVQIKKSTISSVSVSKSGKMGTGMSKTDSSNLTSWAEDHDISAKDLVEAYGAEQKQIITGTSAKLDVVNGGLLKNVDVGKYVAIDCEMVGVGGEEDRSVLARVSIVNFNGTQVYDSFVRPKEFVTDWRTHISGISSKHMATARSFEEVQSDVAKILDGRVLIGHSVKNDLKVMMLGHPMKDIRDTSKFREFRKYSAGRTPSLKKLAKEVLGINIQGGQHSSLEDARVTMLLYQQHKAAFETWHSQNYKIRSTNTGPSNKSKPSRKKKGKR